MERRPPPDNDGHSRRAKEVELPSRIVRQQETQPCPRCGHAMPALKGGSASICPNCGLKDSCCY